MENLNLPPGTGLGDPAADPGYVLSAIPLSPERSTDWRERLANWRALRNAPVFLEDGRTHASRVTEVVTRRLVSVHHTTRYGHLFSNKRIPRDVKAAAMGRYETDLIVITPRRIVVLEVKNWSGTLRLQGDQWIQTQRSGNQIVHNNLLTHNRDKLRVLHQYLKHKGVHLPAERFHQAVVFANPRLDIDPVLREHPAILEFDSLDSALGDGTSAARLLAAKLVDKLVANEAAAAVQRDLLDVIPPAQIKAAAQAIEELRTWDLVTLRGGRVLQGDVLWLRIIGCQASTWTLNPGGEGHFVWRRDLIGGLQWVVWNESPGYVQGTLFKNQHLAPRRMVPLNSDACICFHEAGNPKPSIIALTHVERVRNG